MKAVSWNKTSILLALQLLGSLFVLGALVTGVISMLTLLAGAVASVAFALLLAAHWRGWFPTAHAAVGVSAALTALGLSEPFVTTYPAVLLLNPLVIALVLTSPAWIIGSAVFMLAVLLVRAGGQGVYTNPVVLAIYGMIVGGMVLCRLVLDDEQQRAAGYQQQAEKAAAQLSEAQTAAARQSARLTQCSAAFQSIQQQQQQIMQSIREMVFQTDVVGRCSFLSPSWVEMTGFAVDACLGYTLADFVHPDDQPRAVCRAAVQRAGAEPI